MSSKYKNSRHYARVRAFQVLYSALFSPVEDIVALEQRFFEMPSPKEPKNKTALVAGEEIESADPFFEKNVQENNTEAAKTDYAWTLIEGVWTREESLDKSIESYLHRWRIDRIGKVELIILRLSMYELQYEEDVPPRVVINEALQLTKAFGDEKSTNFVNGLLDAIMQHYKNRDSKSTHI